MDKEEMFFVAIIGGIWAIKDPNQLEEAKKTAKEIGSALAVAGMGLVVYFSDAGCLEPYVVAGYVEKTPVGTGAKSIRVRYAEIQRGQVKFEEQEKRGDLFDLRLFPGDGWEAPFYRSLVEAEGVDAVLLMAGGRSTLIAGQIAVARPLPVLSIDKFDGSAQRIWRELAYRDQEYPASANHDISKMVAWLKTKCSARARERAVLREAESDYRRKANLIRNTQWAGCTFLSLLGSLFLGLFGLPNPSFYPFLMFLALTAAGATGALVRSVIRRTEEAVPFTSFVLGSIAGFVVGAAYVVPQFIGAPEILAAAAATVAPSAKVQLVSAILVSISAGVGFDTVFTRLEREAENRPIFSAGEQR